MRKSLLATVAGAALIAGGGLAAAQQRMEEMQGGAGRAQGSSERAPGGAAQERQPGTMQGPVQGRSGAVEEKERRSGQSGTMQGPARSGAVEEKQQRSGQPGAMQGQTQKRSGAVDENEQRSGHPGPMQGQKSGAVEEKQQRSGHPGALQGPGPAQGRGAIEEQRSGHPGAMQSPTQGRSGAVDERRSGPSGAMQGSAQGRSEQSVGRPSLSAEQRTRLHDTIVSGDVRHVDHVDFSLSVGTLVPNIATFYDIPETIVDIVPQYRGFKYVAVRNELVIVDPGTRKIAALLPTQGSAQGRSGRSVGSTMLSPDQKTRLHGIITGGNVRRIDDVDFSLSVGTRVPGTVTFYDIPETIVDIVPQYRGFRYIVVGEELVIIDPDTLEIVAVIPA